LLKGGFAGWTDENLSGLAANRDLLTSDAAARLDLFIQARTGNVVHRLALLRRSGVYRQTPFGTFGLYLAVVSGRI
jgi:hypothetical protein